MKVTTTVRVQLTESEYFVTSDRYSESPIQVQRLENSAGASWIYCFGPKMLKNGKTSEHRRSCALVEMSTLPEEIREAFQSAGGPVVSVGSEAARQAALG